MTLRNAVTVPITALAARCRDLSRGRWIPSTIRGFAHGRSANHVFTATMAVLLAFVTASAGLVVVWFLARSAQFEAAREELLQIARLTAARMDGDLHERIVRPEQEGSPEHLEAVFPLAQTLSSTRDVVFAYTAILRDNRIYFVLSGRYLYKTPEASIPPDPIMTEYTVDDPPMRKALEQRVEVAAWETVTSAYYGTTLSAYAPFHTRSGKFVGVVGIDMTLAQLERRMAPIERALGAALFVVGLLSLAIGGFVLHTQRTRTEAREAIEASRAKSAFLATMSHEIRTPMNGVLGMLDLLESSGLNEQQSELAHTAHESAQALLRIIDDILDFSKIEAGRMALDTAPLDIEYLMEGVADTLDAQATSKGVELTLFVDPAIPRKVLGDATRLRQVLMNLAGNAVKFCDKSPGQVRLCAERIRADDASIVVRFSVHDDGVGMDERTVASLFSPFTQADAATTRRFGGTGLGLSITRRLIELMHGSIQVRSRLGSGSVFEVRLVFRAEPAPAATRSALHGMRCLIAPAGGSLLNDIAAYLHADGVNVVQLLEPTDLESILAGETEPTVLVVDAGGREAPVARWLAPVIAAWPHASSAPVGIVVVRRGRRRRGRLVPGSIVALDGNVLHRSDVLDAVALAVGRVRPEPPDEVSDDAGAPTPRPAAWDSVRVLVADDNEINRKVVVRQLDLLGLRADVAIDGAQALTMWRDGRYDLVLTDLHMPEMDGYGLARAIRREEPVGTRIPIVALTANALKGEADNCLAAGMDDYLSKPVPTQRLHAVMARWLATGSCAQAGTGEPMGHPPVGAPSG